MYKVADLVIKKSDGKSVVLYLNDISQQGLDIAVENLKNHLIEKIDRAELPNNDVKIVKIVGDLFTIDQWPSVDSANLLNPFDCMSIRVLNPDREPDQRFLNFMQKIAQTSKEGLDLLRNLLYLKKSMIFSAF